MKKTRELIAANLKLVDAVIEVCDARIPLSSRNPLLDEIISGKPRVLLLNKSDLADAAETKVWLAALRRNVDTNALAMNAMSGEGIKGLFKVLDTIGRVTGQIADPSGKVIGKRPLRVMIVGVPNCGKSSLINRLVGSRSTAVGDRPGVTRGKQWLSLENGMQLLDTPGILWPKFEDPLMGLNLAFCGSIRDEIMDAADLALELLRTLIRDYPQLLAARYGVAETIGLNKSTPSNEGSESGMSRELNESVLLNGGSESGASSELCEPVVSNEPDGADASNGSSESNGLDMQEGVEPALAVMEAISLKRGFILPGRRIDYTRTGRMLLDEFRSAKIGRITLEKVVASQQESDKAVHVPLKSMEKSRDKAAALQQKSDQTVHVPPKPIEGFLEKVVAPQPKSDQTLHIPSESGEEHLEQERVLKLGADTVQAQSRLREHKKIVKEEKAIRLKNRLAEMKQYEDALYREGARYIVGIDEVGRGPLAGPVCAAAVVLPPDFDLLGVDDSKKIPEKRREILYEQILERALAWGVGFADNQRIDAINILNATKEAMLSALWESALHLADICGESAAIDHILVDAVELHGAGAPVTAIIKGDALSVSIAAASIIAKVTRDRMMVRLDSVYPGYAFASNKGYGTKAHYEGIARLGLTPIHRRSFIRQSPKNPQQAKR